jgi:hypothetical protein
LVLNPVNYYFTSLSLKHLVLIHLDLTNKITLTRMQNPEERRGTATFQKLALRSLKNSIRDAISQLNFHGVIDTTVCLLQENMNRGKGIFASYIIQAQAASPDLTSVYAALVAMINSNVLSVTSLMMTS